MHDAHPVPEHDATARRPCATGDGAIAADNAKVPLGCVVVPWDGRVVEKAADPIPADGNALLEFHNVGKRDVVDGADNVSKPSPDAPPPPDSATLRCRLTRPFEGPHTV